jgi:MFS family permease
MTIEGAPCAAASAAETVASGREMPPGALVALLGLTQIVGYGTLYYSFGILAPDIAGALGWSLSGVFAAFSGSLLLNGLMAPWAGRLIDRRGAPRVLAAGSLTAAAALAALASATGTLGFVAALVLVQAASTLALYDASFACIVQRAGPGASRGITHLTLIAGFASTLFWPLTSALHEAVGWRGLLWAFAGLNLAIALPIHVAIAFTRTPPLPADGTGYAISGGKLLAEPVQRRALILVTAGFALGGFVLSAVLSQMVLLLRAVGVGETAVLVSALFGPSQVLMRFANMVLGRSSRPIPAAILSGALLPLGVLFLLTPGPAMIGAGLFVVVLGAGSGLKSIVQGTLPLALFGRVAYAERLGRIASARYALASIAPVTLAWLLEHAGPGPAIALLGLAGCAGLACLVAVARLATPVAPR